MQKTKESVLIQIGENVRSARESQGFSQEALAEKAELDRTYVGGVERGERNITVLSLLKLANALSLKLADLVGEVAHD